MKPITSASAARSNRDDGYQVKVWRDKDSIFERIKFNAIVDQVFNDARVTVTGRVPPEPLIALISNEKDVVNERIVHELRFLLKNGEAVANQAQATKQALLSLADEDEDFHINKEQLDLIEHEQVLRFGQLRLESNIEVLDIPLRSGDSLLDRFYKNTAYVNSDVRLAENLARIKILYDEAGISIDRSSLPAINESVFAPETSILNLDNIPERYHQLFKEAKLQALLNQYASTHEDWGNDRARLSGQYPDYLEQLRAADFPSAGEVADAIIRSVSTSSEPFFTSLGDIDTHGHSILLGAEPEYAAATPMIVGVAVSRDQGLKSVSKEFEQLSDFQQRYVEVLSRIRPDGKKVSSQLVREGLKNQLRHFYTDQATGILTVTERELSSVTDSLARFETRGIEPSDIDGDMLGASAINRLIRKSEGIAATKRPSAIFSEQSIRTEVFAKRGLGDIYVPDRFIRSKTFDNQIIITLDDDATNFNGAAKLFDRDPEHSSWLHWDRATGNLVVRAESGTSTIINENTRIYLLGHGGVRSDVGSQLVKTTLGKLTAEELVEMVVKPVFNRYGKRKAGRVVLCGCSLEDSNLSASGTLSRTEIYPKEGEGVQSASYSASLLVEMQSTGLSVGSVTAPNKSFSIDALGHKLYTLNGERVSKPELTRFKFWINADGTVSYNVKHGSDALTSLGVYEVDIFLDESAESLSAYLKSASQRTSDAVLNRHASELARNKSIILPGDTNALALGMKADGEKGIIVISDPDRQYVEGIKAALRLVTQSGGPTEWIDKVRQVSPSAADELASILAGFSDKDAAFVRLKIRTINDGFALYKLNLTHLVEAGVVRNELTGAASSIHAASIGGACGTGSRAKRQTCSQEEIEEQAREASEGLTLLSDDETRLLIGNSSDDIALHTSEPDSVLANVQEGIHDFRRSTTSQRIAEHEGYHNIIALDSESFSAAQTLARNSNEEGRALLLQRNGERVFLTTEDGRVVTMVEGGAHNRITLVGETETFAAFTPEELAGGVRALAQGERVGSVTVQPVVNAGEAFVLQESFDGLGVSDRDSPWREVTDTVRLHALENRSGSVVETGNMQVGKPGQSDTFLFDGDYVRNALKLGRRQQPGVLDAQLRLKRTELHEQGLNVEREVYQSVTVDYARKVQQLKAEFEVFRTAMDVFYEQTSSLSAEEHIPLLSTLRQEVGADGNTKWKMDFADRAVEQTVGTHIIEDERIVRYVLNHDEQIDQVRRVLKLNHLDEADINVRPGETAENFEGVDAPDGIALATSNLAA